MNLKRNILVFSLLAVFISVIYGEISEITTEKIEEIKEVEEEVTDNVENDESAVEYVNKSDEIEDVEEIDTETPVIDDDNKIENVESEIIEEPIKIESRARTFAVAPVENVATGLKKDEKTGRYMDYSGYLDTYNPDNGYDWNDPNNRIAPSEPPSHRQTGGYTIQPQDLTNIRKNFLYWYHDQGGRDGNGDFQKDIHASIPQVHKNFNFQLPFFGFRFNYTRLSLNGYLEFSDPPEHYTYPLVFPIKDWPKRNDPSFIGIFFSKCRIGKLRPDDQDRRNPGVYFRLERDLMTRTDRRGVEIRERVMWDIREGVVGSDTFIPKHVIIATWKNMSFAGGIDNSLYSTNTFQMILATDEVYTYTIFNYAEINWSAHTEAGGDTTGGEGGVPAYIGFNGGNGTQSYEYKPYSQASVLRDLTGRGWANGFPGRHIFRIDEKIMLGTCNKDIDAANLPLVFAPESGNMLGGTVVNITGPCFEKSERVACRFDTEEVVGTVIDRNRAICIQPFLKAQGYIRFEIAIGTERFKWKGKYFVETPATATDRLFFETDDVHKKAPSEIKITWNRYNLTSNLNANVRISLWGYRETTIMPELQYIDMIEEQITNIGMYTIAPGNYRLRDNPKNLDMQFGFLQINLTNPEQYNGLGITPVLWSKPIPLGWYFGPQWERMHGRQWPRALCENWLRTDRFLRNFASEIAICPCTLQHALYDKGRFLPDYECDKDTNPTCLHHKGAIHCVRTGQPSLQGSEQQCCYDRNHFLMLSYDQMWGSRPRRNHNIGQMPWNEANKVPTLSTWWNDVRPYYACCMWQEEQAVGCETFRFERRPSQDCIAYQSPAVAAIFGDPHVVTFDKTEYTFNGMGEFVLVTGNNGQEKIDIQARFEQVPRNTYGSVMATQLTSIAARGNTSTVIEVRVRPRDAQWRYHLDVFENGRRIYFDRPSLKYQYFHGVTVYTPPYILNQSEVVIMFSSGIGVEVIENDGFMSARVYAPWSFINRTRGLFGNWSFDMQDDFTLPDGQVVGMNLNNFESVHKDFALKWMVSDRETEGIGSAMFTREFGRTASHYSNATFLPNFVKDPKDFLPQNRSQDIEKSYDLCGESYQCRYDYGMSLNRDMAHFTKNYHASATQIQKINEDRVISCGILETPRFGRKSNFLFTPGTKVTFECNEGFVLTGDARRTCQGDGRWDVPVYGYTECLRQVFYTRRMAWISTAIVLAVMVPLIMCLVCGVYCYRKKQLKQDPTWKMPIPSRSNSRASLRHLNSDSSDNNTIEKTRNFDASYDTHEPLKGKPDIQFEPKKMDLEEEDITSSEGGEYTNKDKISKEFEYKNMAGNNQKQTGRRGQMPQDNGLPDDDAYPLPPPIAESPISSTYSPTFSGADRGSYPKQLPGSARVLPSNRNAFFGSPSGQPPLQQNVGLPRMDSHSTEV